ncbi:hypothetical protein K443DRAFT_681394 [Laccaria amethystina LaAM-08-1]|uniref:Uncharacterized protein n=1 Tax=Laccaria amethystina LaAM-08-1 TaxID=1095629 RepID=A0A0C9XJ67_9AGAR|nr:hypothetical protein K443DRAFT_681394 [Laccaria amethystina LaAM-08-1]
MAIIAGVEGGLMIVVPVPNFVSGPFTFRYQQEFYMHIPFALFRLTIFTSHAVPSLERLFMSSPTLPLLAFSDRYHHHIVAPDVTASVGR